MSKNNVVIINRGTRVYKLKPFMVPDGKDDAGNPKFKAIPRELLPGHSIETMDAKEAELYLGYRDIADADKVVPVNQTRIDGMQAEIDRLTAENARLSSNDKPAAEKPEPEAEAPAVEAPQKKKKGK